MFLTVLIVLSGVFSLWALILLFFSLHYLELCCLCCYPSVSFSFLLLLSAAGLSEDVLFMGVL